MKTLSKIIFKIIGWKITGSFPNIDKSIVIFAPHTSYWDGFYGKLFFMQLNINYKFLSKKELFRFPLNYFFKAFGSIPVYENRHMVNNVVSLFEENKNLHIVLSPEGQIAKTDHWKKGFYYMAQRANIPIVLGYLDYKKKEAGIKGVIYDTKNINSVMQQINKMYKNVQAKYPEDFAFDKRFS
ncbi:MAG: glycerol acyltransferase [Bacteroidetes bacterium 4572_117]|nr:MAG: glycerol acyltransferase [Bacteroidetes bacterium 4572_117]